MNNVREAILQAVQKLYPDIALPVVELTHPASSEHGEWATNIALALAKQVGEEPRHLAAKIVENLPSIEDIDRVEVAGAGFINFHFTHKYYLHQVEQAVELNTKYGVGAEGKGKQVMVEFGQPNTHKAFHVGHLKSAISGLAIARLLKTAGYEVIQANYFGDVGMQVAKTTWGFKTKGMPVGFVGWDAHSKMRYIDDCYSFASQKFTDDPIAAEEIRGINLEIYRREESDNVRLYKELREWSIEHLTQVFAALGVEYDRQYPESEVYEEALELVKQSIGKLFTKSEGAVIFAGSEVGLNNWVFLTAEGNPTYSAKDLALALHKFRDYPKLQLAIVTTSVEQKDYFKAVIYCLGQIKPQLAKKYKHIPFGWMLRNNRKTSSRMGGSIKGIDVLDEAREVAMSKISALKKYSDEQSKLISEKVAVAGLKFLVLSHEFHKDFNYDPDVFLSFEGFSGPYVLYAYARASSILKQVQQDDFVVQGVELSEVELQLARQVSLLPEILAKAASEYSPHLVCNYVFDLAKCFNQFYAERPILAEANYSRRATMLSLTKATAISIRNGLSAIGIEAIEQM